MMTNPSEFSRRKREQARDLKRRGAYPEAEKALKEALEEAPEDTFLKVSRADLYLRQDRLRESRILVDPVLSFQPIFLKNIRTAQPDATYAVVAFSLTHKGNFSIVFYWESKFLPRVHCYDFQADALKKRD